MMMSTMFKDMYHEAPRKIATLLVSIQTSPLQCNIPRTFCRQNPLIHLGEKRQVYWQGLNPDTQILSLTCFYNSATTPPS